MAIVTPLRLSGSAESAGVGAGAAALGAEDFGGKPHVIDATARARQLQPCGGQRLHCRSCFSPIIRTASPAGKEPPDQKAAAHIAERKPMVIHA